MHLSSKAHVPLNKTARSSTLAATEEFFDRAIPKRTRNILENRICSVILFCVWTQINSLGCVRACTASSAPAASLFHDDRDREPLETNFSTGSLLMEREIHIAELRGTSIPRIFKSRQ
jgi:hypothetical protein